MVLMSPAVSSGALEGHGDTRRQEGWRLITSRVWPFALCCCQVPESRPNGLVLLEEDGNEWLVRGESALLTVCRGIITCEDTCRFERGHWP